MSADVIEFNQALLLDCQIAAASLPYTSDTLEVDRALGELEHAVHKARQEISDIWRANNRSIRDRPPARSPSFDNLTLDDLA